MFSLIDRIYMKMKQRRNEKLVRWSQLNINCDIRLGMREVCMPV